MTNRSFADELEAAAARIGDIPRADLQIMLRRAALRLRNTDQIALDPEWRDTLQSVAAELGMSQGDLVRQIVRDWLVANAYLPAHMLEEDGETAGEA